MSENTEAKTGALVAILLCASLQEPAVSGSACVLAVFDDDLSVCDHYLRHPFDPHAFIQVVINVHVVGLGADETFLIGVKHYNISVTTYRYGALPWKQAE